MAQIQARRYCGTCGRKTLHARPVFGDTVGCLLSVVTLGLFLPVWLAIKLAEAALTRWRCQSCGGARVA